MTQPNQSSGPVRFDLQKEVEKVMFVLEKGGIHHVVRAHVGACFDVSGSTRNLYTGGANSTMQQVVRRIMPLGLACDSNGRIDIWGFSTTAALACEVTEDNFENIIDQEMLDGDLDQVLWGGTEFAPALSAVLQHYDLLEEHHDESNEGFFHWFTNLFGGMLSPLSHGESPEHRPAELPVILYFLTDGENTDQGPTRQIFEYIRSTGRQIFVVLVGVGEQSYSFLQEVADEYPNVGFVPVRDLAEFLSDDGVYVQLLPPKLCLWVKHDHGDEDGDHHEDEDHH